MRIALVIESLMIGGAQRVFCILAKELARRGHTVSLVTFHPPESDLYTLDPKVERINLSDPRWSGRDLLSTLIRNLRRIWRLRRALSTTHFQAAISALDDSNTLTPLACLGTGIPVIASQHVAPLHHPLSFSRKVVRRLAMPLAARLIVLTQGTVPWAVRIMGRVEAVRVIPCPAMPLAAGPRTARTRRRKQVAALGRLAPQKGFDLLTEAFARVAPDHPEWTLTIVGEGPQRAALEGQIADLNLSRRVVLQGAIAQPDEILRAAGLFVLSSRYEGFPVALLEAMACGLPVISFDCPTGPREIIRHEVDGLLVPPEDVSALAAAMARMMSDDDLRRRLAARAPEVLDRFGVEKVVDLWESLLQEVQQNRPAR